MTEGFGTLRKTLSAQQLDELQQLLAAMWKDGFAVGARSPQPGRAISLCHFGCGQPASLPGPEGLPEHFSCRRKHEA